MVSFQINILGAPGSHWFPFKQQTCMQGVYTLYASNPKGLAKTTPSQITATAQGARMPPPLTLPAVPGASTPTRRIQSHLQKACPPASLLPQPPHRQVRLHSKRGPRHVGRRGPGHTHGRPRDPEGRAGGAGPDGQGSGHPLPPLEGRQLTPLPRPGPRGQRDLR